MPIREVSWGEIKDQVAKVNPTFFEAMDKVAYHSTAKLFLASYQFGDLMVNSGVTQLPIDGHLISIKHPELPEPFKTELTYSHMAAGLFLNKTAEVFVDLETRVHPLHMFNVGDIYGLWELLDSPDSPYYRRMWSIAAGARSLFLVPKVTDTASHNRMQRVLNIDGPSPHNMFTQGLLFKNIATSERLNSPWRAEALYLGRGWFEALSSEKWQPFQYACLKQEWSKSTHSRNRLTFEVLWQILSQTQAETRLKPNVYIFESVKHLVSIAMCAFLGFRPLIASKDEAIAPIALIEQAYLEFYKLKYYIPTILAPSYLNRLNTEAVYYSFMLPTLLSLTPDHSFRNTLGDERNVKNLLERLQKRLSEFTDVLQHFIGDTEFNFFHYEPDSIYQINATKTLPQFDARFSNFSGSERIFCENGPFVRSCVMVKPTRPMP
jgi:hypothetical protein